MSTRVHRGRLYKHWHLRVALNSGRFAATLSSPKAKYCSLSLTSPDQLWVAQTHKRNTVSLTATAPLTGRYSVDVSCRIKRARSSALVMRAFFTR